MKFEMFLWLYFDTTNQKQLLNYSVKAMPFINIKPLPKARSVTDFDNTLCFEWHDAEFPTLEEANAHVMKCSEAVRKGMGSLLVEPQTEFLVKQVE